MLNGLPVTKLREATRHFIPESRGTGGLGNVGNREDLLKALRQRGVMDSEVNEFLAGNNKVTAPVNQEEEPWLGSPLGDISKSQQEQSQESNQQDDSRDSSNQQDDSNEDDELELIRKIITKKIKNTKIDTTQVENIIDEKLKDFRKKLTKVIEIKRPNLPNREIGLTHYLTEQIAQVANCKIHQMLVGPAGGGKTTTCEKVAEMLDLEFYPMSVGPQTTKSDLLGFIDAAGNYHSTPLRNAFEKGGLLLLDEVDSANAGVLTIINALLANGYSSFPDGIIKAHDDFRCICACNTYGRGADRQYVGRNQLDAATLDRFAVVDFDYDENLEREIAQNDYWTTKIQKIRKRAFELKQRVVISPRASIFGARLLANNIPLEKVEELVLWKGIATEIRSKLDI